MKLITHANRTIEVNLAGDSLLRIQISTTQSPGLGLSVQFDRAEAHALIAALEILTRLLRKD